MLAMLCWTPWCWLTSHLGNSPEPSHSIQPSRENPSRAWKMVWVTECVRRCWEKRWWHLQGDGIVVACACPQQCAGEAECLCGWNMLLRAALASSEDSSLQMNWRRSRCWGGSGKLSLVGQDRQQMYRAAVLISQSVAPGDTKALTSPGVMASLWLCLCETAAPQQVKAHCSQICNVWLCVPKPFLFESNLPSVFPSSGALKTSSAFLCLSPTCGFLSDALCPSVYWCSNTWCILEQFQVQSCFPRPGSSYRKSHRKVCLCKMHLQRV